MEHKKQPAAAAVEGWSVAFAFPEDGPPGRGPGCAARPVAPPRPPPRRVLPRRGSIGEYSLGDDFISDDSPGDELVSDEYLGDDSLSGGSSSDDPPRPAAGGRAGAGVSATVSPLRDCTITDTDP